MLSIRVHTLDGIVTVMSVDESHTVLEVTRAVCSRIGKMALYPVYTTQFFRASTIRYGSARYGSVKI